MPVGQIVDRLRQTAASYNLPMGDIRKNYNTRLLQELGLWAQEKGKGAVFQAEGFRAYFVDNVNISDTDVLMGIVRRAGLETGEAENVMATRQYAGAVDADWNAVQELEIVAAPTFVIGKKRLVGAQSYESLATFVAAHGAGNRL